MEDLFLLADYQVNNTKPRCTMEAPPAMKPVLAQGAKMLGILERDHGILQLKPEWGIKMSIYQVKSENERPLFLADYSVAAGWHFNDAHLARAKPGLTGDALKLAVGN